MEGLSENFGTFPETHCNYREKEDVMLLCKNVVVNGRRTSMRLEREVWNALSESCKEQNISLNTLCSQIEKSKDKRGLSSAMRVYAFNYYSQLLEDYRKA